MKNNTASILSGTYDAKDAEFCRKVARDLEQQLCWASSPKQRQVVQSRIQFNLDAAEQIGKAQK